MSETVLTRIPQIGDRMWYWPDAGVDIVQVTITQHDKDERCDWYRCPEINYWIPRSKLYFEIANCIEAWEDSQIKAITERAQAALTKANGDSPC